MGQTIPFGPRQKPPDSKKLADKLQVLLLLWPEAGKTIERAVDRLLAELRKSK